MEVNVAAGQRAYLNLIYRLFLTKLFVEAGRRTRMTSGNRDTRYVYGKNGELLNVSDVLQRLTVSYTYDKAGRETKRVYGNGVTQETLYDNAGRVILIKETDARGTLTRAEGYVYDDKGRRTHGVDETGAVTIYQYDNQSRLAKVLYPWTQEKTQADKEEAEDAGLFFTTDKGKPEYYSYTAPELAKLRAVLNKAGVNRGALINVNALMWVESYIYDANGNRAAKITPWGAIAYTYDKENRLLSKGAIVYTYDKDGNLLSEKGIKKEAFYEYNGQGRMAYSETGNNGARTATVYEYDAFGRRTVTQDAGASAMRTLYDSLSFETIREGPTFRGGGFTTNSATQRVTPTEANHTEGERYRWLEGEGAGTDSRYRDAGATSTATRYEGASATLYGRGEALAMNRSASSGTRGGAAYLGKDILGSVRSTSNEYGLLEDRYEYDAFGKPYKGELSGGMNLGYTGKPYDSATGLYNYGYRDYSPQAARFTTLDPIRDGNNWFSYVNNDPVNWIDPWGLKPGDVFSTIDDAAIDFGATYNDDSIRDNKEYGASVYYDSLKNGYTYTEPARGNKDSVWNSVDQANPTAAQLHTHAAYDSNYKNNVFSTDDKNLADKAGVPSYVATPNGSLQKYDPSTGNITPDVSLNMPSDKNDPSRLNTIDPNTGTKDPSLGLAQNILDHAVHSISSYKEPINGGCGK